MLSSLLRARPKLATTIPDPEDIFQSSLGLIFTDDLQNQHGDPGNIVQYRSNGYGDLDFDVADPSGEVERTKFAHYLWNAGVLMAEFIGGESKKDLVVEGEWGFRRFTEGRTWWLRDDEADVWRVDGENVLELGAGL
jgi:nicotinamide N-methyltransferase